MIVYEIATPRLVQWLGDQLLSNLSRPGVRKLDGVSPPCLGKHVKTLVLRLTSCRSCRSTTPSGLESAPVFALTLMHYNISCVVDLISEWRFSHKAKVKF
ncbi:hypothetical protein SFRURICE_008283 [Spodoptera frugiperda]|nr:hypothetical protein SFRURICE_008283 [Spodoptera frugiperda]